jgi:hypothetical protein
MRIVQGDDVAFEERKQTAKILVLGLPRVEPLAEAAATRELREPAAQPVS